MLGDRMDALAGPRLVAVAWAAALGLAALAGGPALAQENSDCLGCHGEKGFTAERKGRTVSLYVGEKAFAGSIHGGLACVNCHADLEGKELPHDAPLKKADCSSLPRGRGEAARGLAPRQGHEARRLARADLCRLPRDARHPGGEGPRLARVAPEGALHLWQVPPGGLGGDAAAQHPPGPHPRELLGVDPRRRAAQEGPGGGRQLRLLPHRPQHPAAHRPGLLDRPRQHREDLHAVPRPDRSGPPQGHQGRAVGEGGPRPARLHRLPPAAQGAEGLLHAGHGGRGLPEVPPGHDLKAQDGRAMFVDAKEHQASRHAKVACCAVPLRGERVPGPALRRRSPRRWTAAPATPRSPRSTRRASTGSS